MQSWIIQGLLRSFLPQLVYRQCFSPEHRADPAGLSSLLMNITRRIKTCRDLRQTGRRLLLCTVRSVATTDQWITSADDRVWEGETNSYLLRAAGGQKVHVEPLTQFRSERILDSDWLQGVSAVTNEHLRNFASKSRDRQREICQSCETDNMSWPHISHNATGSCH